MKLVARGDTSVVDAYLSPILRRYVNQVADELGAEETGTRLMFMQSSGGLTAADLFQAWKTYADARGEAPGTQKAFGDRMASRGFESSRHTLRGRRQRSWTGINLTKRATGNGFD